MFTTWGHIGGKRFIHYFCVSWHTKTRCSNHQPATILQTWFSCHHWVYVSPCCSYHLFSNVWDWDSLEHSDSMWWFMYPCAVNVQQFDTGIKEWRTAVTQRKSNAVCQFTSLLTGWCHITHCFNYIVEQESANNPISTTWLHHFANGSIALSWCKICLPSLGSRQVWFRV
jgi:hypothetical protein